MQPKKRPGRPKDDHINRQITEAVWHLLETRPLASLTINDIAVCANTSRPAIYRRWNSVEEIAVDSFLEAVEGAVKMPSEPHPPTALREYIGILADFLNGRVGRAIAEILGRAQSDGQLMDKFRTGYLMPRRDHARTLINRGQKEGYFRTDLASELIIDLYAGPIYFRAFAKHAPIDEKFVADLSDQVLAIISIPLTRKS